MEFGLGSFWFAGERFLKIGLFDNGLRIERGFRRKNMKKKMIFCQKSNSFPKTPKLGSKLCPESEKFPTDGGLPIC